MLVSSGYPWSPWVSACSPWVSAWSPFLSGLHGLCWSSVVSLSLQGSPLGSNCLTWSQGVSLIVSLVLHGCLLVFLGLHGSLLGLHCFCLVSRDLPWSQGVSAGLQWFPLVSRGVCWSSLVLLVCFISRGLFGPVGVVVFSNMLALFICSCRGLLVCGSCGILKYAMDHSFMVFSNMPWIIKTMVVHNNFSPFIATENKSFKIITLVFICGFIDLWFCVSAPCMYVIVAPACMLL